MSSKNLARIICHWTAGAGAPSREDLEHYHFLVDCTGRVYSGTLAPADNVVTSDGEYAAHTLGLNTRSIGVAMCGMRGAVEKPFSAGPSPINERQFEAFCELVASLCNTHDIPVTEHTVLTHAEVEGVFGVKQRGKWDIARLPWRPDLEGARAVGDLLRECVSLLVNTSMGAGPTRQALRIGMKGVAVSVLQGDLARLRYFSGAHDGHFGPLTRAAVLAFQADNDLVTDGVAGEATWAALAVADARPLREVNRDELDAESGTVKDARMSARVADFVGLGGMIGLAKQASEAADTASGLLSAVTQMVEQNWPALLLCGVCVGGWFAIRALAHNTRARRLKDAQESRSLAR